MKKIIAVACAGIFGLLSGLPDNQAYAASQDECAIWLCLPAGFGTGCGAAHSAFKNRLKKGKSPLPSWNSCSVGESAEPYSYRKTYRTYTNYGNGKIKENRGSNCPANGYIYWNDYKYDGVEAICTTTEIYTTTFYDGSGEYVHEEERWGRPLEETMNKSFKPDRKRPNHSVGSDR
ncbi:hypothetical protein Q4R69_17790 [Morganella morganii subsp. sibonii]